mmetsp:Transcript_49225/g.112105  ORF Transcript_49225/g.112105 Transcript_49225/m.112105 type:complete len:206 (+) Transcript_49225:199-816(+)
MPLLAQLQAPQPAMLPATLPATRASVLLALLLAPPPAFLHPYGSSLRRPGWWGQEESAPLPVPLDAGRPCRPDWPGRQAPVALGPAPLLLPLPAPLPAPLPMPLSTLLTALHITQLLVQLQAPRPVMLPATLPAFHYPRGAAIPLLLLASVYSSRQFATPSDLCRILAKPGKPSTGHQCHSRKSQWSVRLGIVWLLLPKAMHQSW